MPSATRQTSGPRGKTDRSRNPKYSKSKPAAGKRKCAELKLHILRICKTFSENSVTHKDCHQSKRTVIRS